MTLRRNALLSACAFLPLAAAAPMEPKTYSCHRSAAPIRVDGKLNEADWGRAAKLWEFQSGGSPARSKTVVRMLWDDQYLYVGAEMEDVDLYGDIKQRNGKTWFNDVIELFLKPREDRLTYYEFQVTPRNTPLELLFPSRGAGGYDRFAPLTRLGMQSAVSLEGTLNNWRDQDKGWTVELRIPWSAFDTTGGRPKPGDRWRFTCCRYDWSKAYERVETSSSAQMRGDFHRYEDYDWIVFNP